MKSIVFVFLALTACTDGGVSRDPQADWDDVAASFAEAHCAWNWSCDSRQDSQCVVSTTGVLTSSRSELDGMMQARCLDCMQAWTVVYQDNTAGTCGHVLTPNQFASIHAACDLGATYDGWAVCGGHDLPGTSPRTN